MWWEPEIERSRPRGPVTPARRLRGRCDGKGRRREVVQAAREQHSFIHGLRAWQFNWLGDANPGSGRRSGGPRRAMLHRDSQLRIRILPDKKGTPQDQQVVVWMYRRHSNCLCVTSSCICLH